VIHSLNARLLAAFTLIIIVIIGSVIFLNYLTTRQEISRLGERVEALQDARVEMELSRYFLFTRSWDGVQPLVEQWGNLYGRRIILTNNQGTVVADSDAVLLGSNYESDMGRPMRPMMGMGPPSGVLYVVHGELPDINRAALQITSATIGRFFLWGALLAIAIAILLTFLLSRHILAPVKALTQAARKFGRGDFSQRVKSDDKGELGELASSFNSMAEDLERTEDPAFQPQRLSRSHP
jgi:HAMP domain-containing protein